MSRHKWLAGIAVVGAVALVALQAERPRADFQILTHRAGDMAPQKVQAAIDMGVVAVSVIVTWSRALSH
ncbi:hypothetical protein ACNFJ7_10960 [Sphingomonas sp. HT-1]|jgi:hypothetical protein|uniref:hypothetical protein n=1 Tax=unclassified Sphingomonas TaxID=196159 RepID=UPI00030BCA08|nr:MULTISPECIES: hypothetical protein [unclassified Sphingomonas]KTF70388.1 hypothetical protein ATB93_04705 [Sphingomonas sp. WG]